MPRKALLQSVFAASGLAGTLAASAGMLAEDPPAIAGAPFSGVVDVQSTTNFADGNRIVRTNTVHYFRDGQGRTRTERAGLNFQGIPTPVGPTVTINDPVSGQRISLMPGQKMASVLKLPSGAFAHTPAVSACSDNVTPMALMGMGMAIGANQFTEASTATTALGEKSVNGLSVTGCRIVKTIPAGVLGNEKPITSTTEQWVNTGLGMIVQLAETSSLGGSVTLNLGQVALSEPDASLFTTPAGYTVHNVDFSGPATVSAVSDGRTSSVSVATFSGEPIKVAPAQSH